MAAVLSLTPPLSRVQLVAASILVSFAVYSVGSRAQWPCIKLTWGVWKRT